MSKLSTKLAVIKVKNIERLLLLFGLAISQLVNHKQSKSRQILYASVHALGTKYNKMKQLKLLWL